MKKELQDKLYSKYPKIFKQKDLPMTQTCMCWGIECDDGWFKLLDILCSQLQFDIDRNNYPQIEATQVKEKFSSLRFYYTHQETNKEYDKIKYSAQEGMISFAEYLSNFVCEKCGSMDGVTQTKGWMISLCNKCMKKYKKEKK